jgi:DNA-binding SARP family transcriptional activator
MTGRVGALAWTVAAFAITLFAAGVVLSALGSATEGPQVGPSDTLFFAGCLTYAVVGAVVASTHPRNSVGWLLLTEGLLFQLVCFSLGYTHYAVFAEPGRLPGGRYIAWAGDSIWIPILVVAALIFLVFPTGRLRSQRWRPIVWLGLAIAAAGFAAEAFRPGSMGGSLSTLDNPLGIPGGEHFLSRLGAVSTGIVGPFLIGAALLSFVLRFRTAAGAQRQQLRWLAYAAIVLASGFVLGDILQALGVSSSLYSFCYLVPLAVLPVAIGIAVLRYRLYDIEVVIDRTVIVSGVAGFAGIVYAAVAVGAGALVGDRTGSNVVLAAVATAVTALAFQPVLRSAQRLGRRIAYGAPSRHEEALGLALRCLGAFRVFRDGHPLSTTAWQSKKARTLLKILVARRGRSTPRAMLMEELWPGEDPAVLSNRLSVALATVRSVLDPHKQHPADRYVAADKDAMRLDLENVAVDVEDFLACAASGLSQVRQGQRDEGASALAEAVAMYPGDFLEEDSYEDWAHALREEVRATYIAVARTLAEISVEAGHHDAAIGHYLRILAKDAWDEKAHLGLVWSLETAGRHGEARRSYREYAARMTELDLPIAPFPT